MASMLEIDGSYGEGGGQVLRTSLSLSCLARKPFRIFNIRQGRRKPGLMPQHLTCVRALGLISSAEVTGDYEGSQEITFKPSRTKPGGYSFDIGTAGSVSLLLQSLIPALAFAEERSRLTLKGGTHVPFSPCFQYIQEIFIPMLSRLGIKVGAEINRYGFYPKGGGEIQAEILPTGTLEPVNLLDRGELKYIKGISGVANLPESIAGRQRIAALSGLEASGLRADVTLIQVPAYGRGTFLFLKAESDACAAGFSSLGERGKKAETVGAEAFREFSDYYKTPGCLDPHLADQIIPYLAYAKKGSSFTISRITGHLLTNLHITEKFLGMRYSVEGNMGNPGKIIIYP